MCILVALLLQIMRLIFSWEQGSKAVCKFKLRCKAVFQLSWLESKCRGFFVLIFSDFH